MKNFFLIAAILSVVLADKYAIVFQGDRGYMNYSDSANTCRGFNDIIASGIPYDHVIYMANEDTLTNEENPWPNKLFTLADPEGEGWDHAKDCKDHFDYYGKNIEPEIVLAVIRQDEEAVKKLTGLEHPKVFHTTEKDTIFIYYSDHGYEGGVGCGSGVITTEQMQDALKDLHANHRYDKLAFFLEACESGSVFDTLPSDLNIYAFTSANATELAWCDYCPPNDVVNGKEIGVCMSMYYDNAYQAFWEAESTTITLHELYQKTHDEVAKFTHQEVSEWGDLSMGSLPMTTFIGDKPIHVHTPTRQGSTTRVEKSEAPLHEAKWRAIRGANNEDELRQVINSKVKNEIEAMRLGAAVLGEKEMDKKMKEDTAKYDRECVSDVLENLMTQCGHSLPFPHSAVKMVKAVCANGYPKVNWSEVCM